MVFGDARRQAMIVVSGCPRSGTSMMMNLLRTMLGEERCHGKKFPQQQEMDLDSMPAKKRAAMEYLKGSKKNDAKFKLDRQEKSKNMNPEGFWECSFTVGGFSYSWKSRAFAKKNLEDNGYYFAKIVAQGLMNTDPRHIDRIIYMARHPSKVAESQQDLFGKTMVKDPVTGESVDLRRSLNQKSLEMYLAVTQMAGHFFAENQDIPMIVIDYDAMLEDPKATCEYVAEFLCANENNAHTLVNKKLSRSKISEEELGIPDMKVAVEIHQHILKEEWEEVRSKKTVSQTQAMRGKHSLKCARTNLGLNLLACDHCRGSGETAKNLRKGAIKRGWRFEDKPCLAECGLDPNVPEEDALTIEESIAKAKDWGL